MTDEPKEMQCGQCHRSFNERQLNFKMLTVESCPFCSNVVRKSEHSKMRRHDAIIVEDVAAIDAWLDAYSTESGLAVSRDSKNDDKEHVWALLVSGKWRCQVAYQPDKTNFVAIRIFTTEMGEKAFADPTRLQLIVAAHGAQPYGTRWSDGITGTVEHKWGVARYLSTDTLCNEVVEPTLKQLCNALDDAWGQMIG